MASLFSRKSEKGQGLVEYTLLFILIAIPLIAVLTPLGPQIKTVFTELVAETTGGVSVEDGVLYIPDLSPTFTPVSSSTPEDESTLTPSPTATLQPTATLEPTATTLACTSGSATVSSKRACSELSSSYGCDSYSYNRRTDLCTWP